MRIARATPHLGLATRLLVRPDPRPTSLSRHNDFLVSNARHLSSPTDLPTGASPPPNTESSPALDTELLLPPDDQAFSSAPETELLSFETKSDIDPATKKKTLSCSAMSAGAFMSLRAAAITTPTRFSGSLAQRCASAGEDGGTGGGLQVEDDVDTGYVDLDFIDLD